MRLAGILFSYVLAIGILGAALIGGVMWLVTPGPAVSHEARIAPIPPRLADSIERKKPLPVPEPEPAKPAIQDAAVMKEAPASLTQAPVRSFKIRELNPPPKQKQSASRAAKAASRKRLRRPRPPPQRRWYRPRARTFRTDPHSSLPTRCARWFGNPPTSRDMNCTPARALCRSCSLSQMAVLQRRATAAIT